MSNENKLVKTVTDSAVLIGLAAGVGYVAKKADERIIYERPILKYYKLCKMGCCIIG